MKKKTYNRREVIKLLEEYGEARQAEMYGSDICPKAEQWLNKKEVENKKPKFCEDGPCYFYRPENSIFTGYIKGCAMGMTPMNSYRKNAACQHHRIDSPVTPKK